MDHPTVRVLALLELLQAHGRLSGAELARRLEVDVRTVRRDLSRLEALGIPITAERGRHGAYQLVAGYKLPPMLFTDGEAVALSVGLAAARGLGLAGAPAVASAQAKLARVMPPALRRRAEAVDQAVTLDVGRGGGTAGSRDGAMADHAVLSTLSLATQARQRVRLRYRDRGGGETERGFDPYGLVHRGGRWYAVGHCLLRRGPRSFRLDRVVEVSPLADRFERPEGFDALAHVTEAIAALPRAHEVLVLLRAEAEVVRRAIFGALGLIEAVDGGTLLRCQTDDLGWLARELARLPFDLEVVRPAAMRAALAEHGRRLLAAARRAAPPPPRSERRTAGRAGAGRGAVKMRG